MAGRLKKKVRLNINLYETTNNNRLKTGGTLTAYIYPGGTQIESTATIPLDPATQSLDLSGRGAMLTADTCDIVRENDADAGLWVSVGTGRSLAYANLAEKAATQGQFAADFRQIGGTADFAPQVGDRVVSTAVATLYEDESDQSDTIANPIDVPTNGVVEFYCEHDSVDVYLTGSTITDGWYAFNVPAGDSSIGALNLTSEIKSADSNGDIAIDSRTGIVLIDDATYAIDKITEPTADRLLLLVPTVSGVSLTTTTSITTDGLIHNAAGGTINLDQHVPILLVAREHTSDPDIHYWTILGTPNVNDFALNDLTDVTITSADEYAPLVYVSGTWIDALQLGTASVPMATIYVEDGGTGLLIEGASSIFASFDASGLSASRAYVFPDVAGTFVLSAGNIDIAGRKTFDDGASGFRIANVADDTRIADFNCSSISTGTIRSYTLPDKSGTFALIGDTPDAVDDLSDVTITAVADEDILKYDLGTAKWVNSKIMGAKGFPMEGHFDDQKLHVVEAGGNYEAALRFGAAADTDFWFGNKAAGFTGLNILKSAGNHAEIITLNFPFDDGAANTGLFEQLQNAANQQMILRVPDDLLAAGFTEAIRHFTISWLMDAVSLATPTLMTLALYKVAGLPSATTVPPVGGTELSGTAFNVPSTTSGRHQTGTVSNPGSALTFSPGQHLILGIKTTGNTPGVSGTLQLCVHWRPQPGAT